MREDLKTDASARSRDQLRRPAVGGSIRFGFRRGLVLTEKLPASRLLGAGVFVLVTFDSDRRCRADGRRDSWPSLFAYKLSSRQTRFRR